MADIYARLKTTPNGPGPQHKVEGKTEFEFTEGKDGKLNVRDVDVKAELELIKQQQQQILDRLKQPVKTELTGSIGAKSVGEEMVVHEDEVTIAPNSSIVLESAELAGLAGKTKIRVYLLRPSQNHELKLMSRIRRGTGWAAETIENNGSSTAGTVSYTYDLEFPITTHETPRLRIINRSADEEMTVETTIIVAI